MLQIYFLSILLNVVAGLILVYATDFTAKKSEAAEDAEAENQDSEVEKISDDSTDSEGDSVFDKKLQFAINSKDTFFDDVSKVPLPYKYHLSTQYTVDADAV